MIEGGQASLPLQCFPRELNLDYDHSIFVLVALAHLISPPSPRLSETGHRRDTPAVQPRLQVPTETAVPDSRFVVSR